MHSSPSRSATWAGFTLIEVLTVVAIIGIVAAIGMTNLIKSRNTAQKNTCIANLRQIDSAMQQWVLENKKGGTDTYSLTDGSLLPFIKGSRLPVCPGGGTYNAGAVVCVKFSKRVWAMAAG